MVESPPGRHHSACFLFMSIMQHFLTASPSFRAFNTCFCLVAINTRWSISYSQVSPQPTCLTRLNRLMYCKRALMSVIQRDRWSPSILRQYNRPWMLVNSCTKQQIWSGHIQTPTTSRTLQCNQEMLELALDSHWKLFITPLHVFFLTARYSGQEIIILGLSGWSTAWLCLIECSHSLLRLPFCWSALFSDPYFAAILVCANRMCSWINICWYLSSVAINQSNFSVRVSMKQCSLFHPFFLL